SRRFEEMIPGRGHFFSTNAAPGHLLRRNARSRPRSPMGGAPWTVATYIVGGEGSVDQAAARLWAYRDPQGLQRLIGLLEDVSVEYLSGQIDAGADLVQIFDSWAGSLPEDQFRHWVIEPTRRLVGRLKERHPTVPVIGFPRGAHQQA